MTMHIRLNTDSSLTHKSHDFSMAIQRPGPEHKVSVNSVPGSEFFFFFSFVKRIILDFRFGVFYL